MHAWCVMDSSRAPAYLPATHTTTTSPPTTPRRPSCSCCGVPPAGGACTGARLAGRDWRPALTGHASTPTPGATLAARCRYAGTSDVCENVAQPLYISCLILRTSLRRRPTCGSGRRREAVWRCPWRPAAMRLGLTMLRAAVRRARVARTLHA